jgi:hypothetical protein
MKINLPNYLCTHFEVRANFAVSDAVGEPIGSAIQQTSNHDHVATRSGLLEATVGVFGSRFSAKGIQHRAIGNLAVGHKDEEHWLDVWLVNRVENAVPPPPRAIKPVSLMMDVIAATCEPAKAEINAMFEYYSALGWISKIAFPIPILLPSDSPGITHIESAEFSHRDDSGVHYKLIVYKDADENKILHSASFSSEVEWNNGSFRRSLNYARTISTRLMMAKEGAENGKSKADRR